LAIVEVPLNEMILLVATLTVIPKLVSASLICEVVSDIFSFAIPSNY